MKKTTTKERENRITTEKCITYFSKESERKIFFVLTIIMLLAGILTKLGLF